MEHRDASTLPGLGAYLATKPICRERYWKDWIEYSRRRGPGRLINRSALNAANGSGRGGYFLAHAQQHQRGVSDTRAHGQWTVAGGEEWAAGKAVVGIGAAQNQAAEPIMALDWATIGDPRRGPLPEALARENPWANPGGTWSGERAHHCSMNTVINGGREFHCPLRPPEAEVSALSVLLLLATSTR